MYINITKVEATKLFKEGKMIHIGEKGDTHNTVYTNNRVVSSLDDFTDRIKVQTGIKNIAYYVVFDKTSYIQPLNNGMYLVGIPICLIGENIKVGEPVQYKSTQVSVPLKDVKDYAMGKNNTLLPKMIRGITEMYLEQVRGYLTKIQSSHKVNATKELKEALDSIILRSMSVGNLVGKNIVKNIINSKVSTETKESLKVLVGLRLLKI